MNRDTEGINDVPDKPPGHSRCRRGVRETVLPVPAADTRRAVALSMFLGGAGVTHFAAPKFYDVMIPEQLPGAPRTWTYGSGVAEIAVATAVLVPRTRRAGGLAAALLFGNVKQALDARRSDSTAFRIGTLLRLPMQVPLIAWAMKVRATAR
jgi:uncharacterized membrane protein